MTVLTRAEPMHTWGRDKINRAISPLEKGKVMIIFFLIPVEKIPQPYKATQ